jgi:transcriptional regulator with XRE-family HTH domain
VADQVIPSMRRRRLGRELRALREAAGLRIETVAARVNFSPSKVSRIETGHIGVTPQAVTSLLVIYAAPRAKVDEVSRLARQATHKTGGISTDRN